MIRLLLAAVLVFLSVDRATAEELLNCVKTYLWEPKGEQTAQSISDTYIGAENLCGFRIRAIVCVQSKNDRSWVHYFNKHVDIGPGEKWSDVLLSPNDYLNVEAFACRPNVSCANTLRQCPR